MVKALPILDTLQQQFFFCCVRIYRDIPWLVVEPYPSEKYDFVSWGYEIPNWMESHKNDVPNHQADCLW